MKELLAVIALLASGALAQGPAPYAPSGWRPNGPAFELPQKTQTPQKQEYLPPVDPRRPTSSIPADFGPEGDVSVQGLPTQEQQPLFQLSPVSGQQYVGPSFNSDIKNLDQGFGQSQFQLQQEKAREFARQRQQLEAAQANNGINRVPNPQVPGQFVPRTTVSSTDSTFTTPDYRTTQAEATTESQNLNEGEILDDNDEYNELAEQNKEKVSVEVTKQNVQAFPPELLLSPLTQVKLQSQFVPLQQLGQIRAPVFFQPIQQEIAQRQVAPGFDAATHFAALPSILGQKQVVLGQPQAVIQSQQGFVQSPALLVRGQDQPSTGFVVSEQQPLNQYQPAISSQYQPQSVQGFPVSAQPLPSQPQPQPQPNQFAQPRLPEEDDDEKDDDQNQTQFDYQQSYQPQEVYQQPFPVQSQVASQYPQEQQNLFAQTQLVNFNNPDQDLNQYYQSQLVQQQQFLGAQGQVPQQQVFQGQVPQQQVFQNQAPQPQVFQGQAPQPQVFQGQAPQPQVFQGQAPQPQVFQGQAPQSQVFQGQAPQPQSFQGQVPQTQIFQEQIPQQPFAQTPQVYQGQDAFLQSGLDINQQGNGIEQTEDATDEPTDNNDQDDGSSATAVATAFGTRTQPRVFAQYGAPFPVPQSNPRFQTTTESTAQNEDASDDGPVVAEARAVARGNGRKSAKLRTRRFRPVFTLDKSGHLVIAQEQ